MRLLLDEMHSPVIADSLRADGHDVTAVAGSPELPGTPDAELLEYVTARRCVLVTENVADLAPLASLWTIDGRAHAGLIFTSARRFDRASLAYPGNLITALRQFLDEPRVEDSSWIWWL